MFKVDDDTENCQYIDSRFLVRLINSIKSILAKRFRFFFSREMLFVVIFRPRTAQTGFFSSETSETGFSSSGKTQTGFFSRQSRLLAFLRLRRVFGFSSPVISKLAFLRTAGRYTITTVT